ncbi:hypothetical protein [Bradyrhizobium sp. RDM4]|uniref:hypothetical protein n=1 Tax=Bradyrhizobium sp. RDM4 TaxID=3378765 RepID=UPI0038FCCC54
MAKRKPRAKSKPAPKVKKAAKAKAKKARKAKPDPLIEAMSDLAEEQFGTGTKIVGEAMRIIAELSGPSPKIAGRGMSQGSRDLIDAMRIIAEAAQPITGRGVGYKLFTQGLIPSMERNEMRRVYRLLLKAREDGIIPWEWIVDETRAFERIATWDDPDQYARDVATSYRRDFWNQQPLRVEVWSEKGTVRGVLQPVLDDYAVGFRVMHGFSGATTVHDVAQDDDGRTLVALYVGDFDPSGMFMSEVDLPARLDKYQGHHVMLKRIALTREQLDGLPSFAAATKQKDPRYNWFVANHGRNCWELDAMDPNNLRDCVEQEIKNLIEPVAWERCDRVNKVEQESLRDILANWPRGGK